ncbi:MAG TPA: AAA family ATPase [Candidatus Limnocylindria bacterium]|nr:AAA family ATPase [Candidatus Limnocylindria bacterium]
MVDREAERRLVASFLDAPDAGVRALVLQGAAGIGKTTIWQAAIDDVAVRGRRLLVTRPSEAEARLPFVGLHDLLAEVLDEPVAILSPPQQAAIDGALMRGIASDAPIQPLALSLAVLEVLRSASAKQPLAIAIDDAQWLDDSSASVLRFALRRLEHEPIVVLATHRAAEVPAPPPAVLADLAADRVTRVVVRGLAREALDQLLDVILGLRLAPTALGRVHRAAAGNPLHALEIGRALLARPTGPSDDALPVPESLGGLVAGRLVALPEAGRDVAVVASALSQPTRIVIERVLGADVARAGIEAARAAGVLDADGETLRFTHPLLAAEAYATLGDASRHDLHRRLADAVFEPDEHARHLALSASGPDADVAASLAIAADRAHRRGAPDAAAELAERAAELTPTDAVADRLGRVGAAARFHLLAGDIARARCLLEEALTDAGATATVRAELLHGLALVRMLGDDFVAASVIAEEALAAAEGDAELTIRLRMLLAGVSYVTGEDWKAGAAHAAEAMRIADELGDPRVVAATIGHHATWRFVTGHTPDSELEQRAADLAPYTDHLRALDRPEHDFAAIALAEGDTRTAAARVRTLLAAAEDAGDYTSLPFLLSNAAMFDWLAGDLALARERLDRAERLADATEQGAARAHVLAYRARLEARVGDAEAARAVATRAFDVIAATGWRVGEWAVRADLALLELSVGDPAAAVAMLADAAAPTRPDATGRRRWSIPVAVHALIGLGRHDEAEALLGSLERYRGHVPGRLRADILRARARLLAATGSIDAAEEAIGEVEARHRDMDDPWELARTLLVAGEIHRRARRRAAARRALLEAADLFAGLGAERWSETAREQLGRIGQHRDSDGLTPAQLEVAQLAASGLTNREVGDRLFMSPHTVEAHLSQAYRALAIRSRVELAAALSRAGVGVRDSEAPARDSAATPPLEV